MLEIPALLYVFLKNAFRVPGACFLLLYPTISKGMKTLKKVSLRFTWLLSEKL